MIAEREALSGLPHPGERQGPLVHDRLTAVFIRILTAIHTASCTRRTASRSTARPCANHRKNLQDGASLTPTPPSEPLMPSTGTAVRDHRNAVRDRSEHLSAITGIRIEAEANISDVARRHGVARGLLTIWRRQRSSGGQEPVRGFATVKIDPIAAVSNDAPRHSSQPDAVAMALPAVRSRGRIEIDIAGARIRVESGVDQATLAMVLAAVRGDK
jgi:transposase